MNIWSGHSLHSNRLTTREQWNTIYVFDSAHLISTLSLSSAKSSHDAQTFSRCTASVAGISALTLDSCLSDRDLSSCDGLPCSTKSWNWYTVIFSKLGHYYVHNNIITIGRYIRKSSSQYHSNNGWQEHQTYFSSSFKQMSGLDGWGWMDGSEKLYHHRG